MALANGTQLGPYEIVAPIGAGGMGEVYRARDTKLEREVAIKVLPDTFARDPERVARFQREAKVLASLNHPNIAAIYGFETTAVPTAGGASPDRGGASPEAIGRASSAGAPLRRDKERRAGSAVHFLVLELVEGETLAERLHGGALPVDEALEVCKQIAEALEAAHERGVIHRDLKPANVKVTPDGVVKVLDFGLAKAFVGDASGAALADSPTITVEHTRPGVVLGTAAYMSPEQARGKPLDKRTDIWSFGCVLYECLTGQRPFLGETASDTIAKILERDPDYERLPHNTPLAIRNLLHHCVEKDRKRRLRDIGDAVVELDEAISTRAWSTTALAAAGGVPTYKKRRAGLVFAAVLLFALGAALGAGLWHLVRPRSSTPVSRMSITFPPMLKVRRPPSAELSEWIRLSPDGQTLAFLAERRDEDGAGAGGLAIYTRRIDRYEVSPVKGTDGTVGFVFSPDSRWLAFVGPAAPDSDKKRLAKVPVDGHSPPLTLTDWRIEWSSWMGPQFVWLPDGDILILAEGGHAFTRVPSEGGTPAAPVKIERGEFTGFIGVSSSLPDERAVLVNLFGWGQRGFQKGVALLDLETASMRVLIPDGSRGAYAATGHLLFSRGETLLAAPFDVERLEPAGGPVAIAAGVRTSFSWDYGDFEVGRNGTLVYAPGGRAGRHRRIVFVDQEGNVEPWSQERRALESNVTVSPDGRRIAAILAEATGLYEIWTSEVAQPRLRRLAALADADCYVPCWSPDGELLAYSRHGKNELDGLFLRRADGTDEPERLAGTESPETDELLARAWSPGGSYLLVERMVGETTRAVLLLPLEPDESGERTLRTLLDGPFPDEFGVDFSPDGKWITYNSDETGRNEVYVRAFHADATLGPTVPITASGGWDPIWSRDGKTILYRSEGRVMAVEIAPDVSAAIPTVSGQPRVALDFDQAHASQDDYSVLPDGRLVVIQKGEDEDEVTRVNVVLNWFEELKAKVPTETDR